MPAEKSFWQLLRDVGREHDRQLAGLLVLTRDLRLELDRATRGEEMLGLQSETGKQPSPLSLTDRSTVPSVDDREPPLRRVQPLTLQASPAPPITQLDSHSGPTINPTPVPKPALGALPTTTDSKCPTDAHLMMESAEPTAQKSTDDDTAMFAVTFNQPANLDVPPPPSVPEPVPSPHQPVDVETDLSEQDLQPKTQETLTGEATEGAAGWLDQCLWFVTTPWFETFAAFLIVINTIIMMMEAQYLGMQAGYITGFPGVDVPVEESWPWAVQAFFITDRLFTAIFFFELMVRILRFRIEFFKVPLNWIDILAVLGSVAQALMHDVSMNPTVVRLLRVVRPVRSIRFLKNKQIQRSLSILMKCLQASVVTLFWSLCLLLMIQCMIGMVASQIAQDFVSDLNNPEQGRHEVFRYYGTFSKCLVTMFEIHMANWAAPCRVVLNNVGEISGNMLVFYRCVMGYALMSVLGAVFVQQAMSVQQQDQELMILKKQKEAERYTKKLRTLFGKMDTNGDGQLCRQEFDAVTDDQELKAWMESLDINPDDLTGLFDMLDTGDGFVSFDEFLMGATRVRGDARNIDVAQLMVTVGRLEHMMEKTLDQRFKGIEQRFDGLQELHREQTKRSELAKDSSWRMFG